MLSRFPDLEAMKVIDLGGTTRFWTTGPVRPKEVVLVNLSDQPSDVPGIRSVVGDVCQPIAAVAGEHFDLVFSNSVIEHVGGHDKRWQMAEMVRVLGDQHWVQTPYRYFPIEPHFLFPGFQFLPTAARAHAAQWWPLSGGGRSKDYPSAVINALRIELLDRTQMELYFPGSELLSERVAGLTKSLIAVG
jgi:Methyltransferase domain